MVSGGGNVQVLRYVANLERKSSLNVCCSIGGDFDVGYWWR